MKSTLLKTRPIGARARWLLVLSAVAVWLASVGTGLALLTLYEHTPGSVGPHPARWPEGSRIPANRSGHTLVLFAHPRCPCTRASIGELATIMARSQATVKAHVLFVQPEGAGEAWRETDLWHAAAAIQGVSVVADRNAREARLFGAATSGHTLVYGSGGALLFSGGITASRGHSGDNAGRAAVLAISRGEEGATEQRACCVFGCPLSEAENRFQGEDR